MEGYLMGYVLISTNRKLLEVYKTNLPDCLMKINSSKRIIVENNLLFCIIKKTLNLKTYELYSIILECYKKCLDYSI